MKKLKLLLAGLCLTLASCAYHEEYPKEWAPIAKSPSNDCPNISGKYLNIGVAGRNNFKPNLARKLFGRKAPWKESIYLSFNQSKENEVVITLWDEKNSSIFETKLAQKTGEFSCEGGLLKIDTGEFINRDGVLGKEWSVLGFTKNSNDLIVKNENGAIGIMFLVPVAGTGTNWYKYRELIN